MNQWQTGQPDGLFGQSTPSHLNPSMFSNLATPTQFDLNTGSPFQQPGLQNGNQTPTPSFTNQTFQPGSVVPQKRAHDGGMSGSPPPPLPPSSQASRAQTPSYPGFPNQQPGQQFHASATPNPYSHLQQPGSNHATPSPTMQNQQFRQPSRMSNASPSPFPQQSQQQQQGGFGNQMTSAGPQNQTQPTSIPQQSQMNAMNQYGISPNMAMQGMQSSMPGQAGNMTAMAQASQQRQYQMRLMQQQAALRQQNGGVMPQRNQAPSQVNSPYGLAAQAQAQGGQMPNGQANSMLQAQQMKRTQFLQHCATYTAKQGRQFNPTPTIGGRPLELYTLFTVVIAAGGSSAVDRNGHWQAVANKIGFNQAQYPTAAENIREIYAQYIAMYEKMWMTAKTSQKQEQARQHAQQMAGLGPPTAHASPTKTMPPPPPGQQQNAFPQFQQQAQQPQPHPGHATPVQANVSLPQNGTSTPQQVMGAPGSLQHRRNSSMRKMDAMTPQPGQPAVTMPSPHAVQKAQQSPSVKPEPVPALMKSQEVQSSNYEPNKRSIEFDGGFNTHALYDLGKQISLYMPLMPTVDEMGTIDTRAITLSLASGIHAEVRYALDALAIISTDSRVSFELEKCDDLIDVIIDCAEEQTDILADEAEEVSDSIDLPSYEDVIRGTRTEAETLQDVPQYGTPAYTLDRAADKVIAITTILRNLSFYEHNHRLLTSTAAVKWLSNTLRLLGTRNMFLRTFLNTQDFYKDTVTFLSNITQSLELPTRDDALHILEFLLVFTPQPAPAYSSSRTKFAFTPFVPAVHRYLPPAVDSLAKLLARQDPNRILYKTIFGASNNSLAVDEGPMNLLTRAFALSISVIPDRSKGSMTNSTQLRIVEARKPYLTQGMLAADILTTFLPNGESDVARAWIESEDGWAASLLSLASLLSVDQPPRPPMPKQPPIAWDTESFKLISHRALAMMKRLAEKGGKGAARRLVNASAPTNGLHPGDGEAENDVAVEQDFKSIKRWEGIPQGHAIIGAMMLGNIDKTALGLLCGLHEMAT